MVSDSSFIVSKTYRGFSIILLIIHSNTGPHCLNQNETHSTKRATTPAKEKRYSPGPNLILGVSRVDFRAFSALVHVMSVAAVCVDGSPEGEKGRERESEGERESGRE